MSWAPHGSQLDSKAPWILAEKRSSSAKSSRGLAESSAVPDPLLMLNPVASIISPLRYRL
jgi:hypothetical protein